MSGFLGRKWPAPVAKPMWAFYVAGVVILYGINGAANGMAQSPEYKDDPNNHILRRIKAQNGGH